MTKRVLVPTICVLLLSSSTAFALADNDSNTIPETEKTVYITLTDADNTVDLNNYQSINKAIEEYDHVKLIVLDEGVNSNSEVPVRRNAADAVVYKPMNIVKCANTYGADYYHTSGAPGITIGLSRSETKTYSITFGATYNCSTSLIANAAWGTTQGTTLTYSGTWQVPNKHNGKSVKRGTLHMRPEYSVKKYDIYSKQYGSNNWIKCGSSKTKRAYGVDIYKTFTYN